MSRAYDNKQTLQQKIINGVNILADNVASTLGPRGRNVSPTRTAANLHL